MAQQLIINFYGRSTVHTLPVSSSTSKPKPKPTPIQTLTSFALHQTQTLTGIPQHFLQATPPSPTPTHNHHTSPSSILITLRPCLLGGKGGFGAALRASGKSGGAQTTNFGACRDLNGRRLRHVNNEIRLRIWREKQDQLRRAKARGEKLDPSAVPDLDKSTASGIEGWHLAVPQWAEGLGKVKRQRLHRKTRLCVNWVRAREGGRAPKGAPRWWGCPRGRSCDFAHGESELDEDARRKLEEERRKERKMESNEKVMRHAREMMEREGAMHDAVLKGLKRAEVVAQEKRLKRVREVGETLAVGGGMVGGKEEGGGLAVDGLAGEMGVGATGEIEGRSEFATAGSPLAAVRDGRWYYEAEILSQGIVQLGFGSDEFVPDQVNGDGVGDCPGSWSYDGSRGFVFDQGEEQLLELEGSRWTKGDIVGCLLDLSARPPTCRFTLNGKTVASFSLGGDSYASASSTPRLYYPAVSLNSGQAVRLNYGQMPFRCCNASINPTPFAQALRSPDKATTNATTSLFPSKAKDKVNAEAEAEAPPQAAMRTKEPSHDNSAKEPTKDAEGDAKPAAVREVDLESCDTEAALEMYSLEELKVALQKRGLKCGGTLEERRKRLFSIKGLQAHEIDASLIAGAKSKRKKSRAGKRGKSKS